jgi:hypothetical protein
MIETDAQYWLRQCQEARRALPEALALLAEAREDWIEDEEIDGKPNDLGKRIDAYLAKFKD